MPHRFAFLLAFSTLVAVGVLPPIGPRVLRAQAQVGATQVEAPAGAVRAPVAEWDVALADFAADLSADVAADDVGGIAAGVVVDGDLVWARGFGWADRDTRRPMTPAAVSRTGSISKTVTAMLLLRLVDQGVVALDDPMVRWLPEFAAVTGLPENAPPVTLRMVASHTAGLEREPANREAMVSGPLSAWEERIVESLRNTAFDTVPGARYRYSNIGYGALGLALSRAAGAPFMELVEREVFVPLGMTASTFAAVGGELEPRLATGYANRRDGTIDAARPRLEHAGRGYKVPNGGVYSTVADLGRFLGAIAGVPGLRLLAEESRRAMIAVQTPEDPREGYGLGLSITTLDDGRTVVGHGGSVAGYTAYMAVEPASGVGVILLRNYQRGETNLGRAARGLLGALAGGAP